MGFVIGASFLALLAFLFSIGGLVDVWWSGTYEMQMGPTKITVGYAMTLWENTVVSGSTAQIATVDDQCAKSELPEEDQANCDKIMGIRAFVFLLFFSILLTLACQASWMVQQFLYGDTASSLLQKHLLTTAIASKIFASFCAFVAACIAPSLEFQQIGNGAIGASGAGYVLTILLMIFFLWPAIALECIVWKRTHWITSETPAETKVQLPKISELPTLVGATSAAKISPPSSQNPPDLEASGAAPK